MPKLLAETVARVVSPEGAPSLPTGQVLEKLGQRSLDLDLCPQGGCSEAAVCAGELE